MKIETDEEKEWYKTRPTLIKMAIDKIPDGPCYKLKDHVRGHYGLHSITESLETGKATAKMVHLDDSFGFDIESGTRVAVFGIEIDDIVQCGCGDGAINGKGV